MAITTVNPRYEGFIFDGENSRDYGIYVQDVKVFGAPTRDVEMISIPGRDGEFALDKGRFNNIQVVYTCAFGTDTQTDFNTGVSDFRNWLASRKGYKRLEDEINTAEYRMAVFKDGLDVSTLNKETGTFEVTFDCKPQRFLKSGENAVTVASGGTLTNPTPFDASPLLQVWGYGSINLNNDTITIIDEEIGDIVLANAKDGGTNSLGANKVLLRNTDTVTLGASNDSYLFFYDTSYLFSGFEYTVSGDVPSSDIRLTAVNQGGFIKATVELDSFSCAYGSSDVHPTVTISATLKFYDGTTHNVGVTFYVTLRYRNNSTMNAFTFNADSISRDASPILTSTSRATGKMGEVTGYSTKTTLGEPLYFDLDIGEAYKEEDGEFVSINDAVIIPAELPVLNPGANTITFDNSINTLKVIPRWWKV